jgi:acyl-CoA thioesterase I
MKKALLWFSVLLMLLGPVQAKTLLVLGDSISAAYGLKQEEGWVSLLQKHFDSRKTGVKVINASVSGDTTANGKARLPALLAQHKPSIVIIELGGNDALRGAPLSVMRGNLEAMIRASHAIQAKVLVLGMQIPPNFGPAYTKQFAQSFSDAASVTRAALVPFFLEPLGTSLQYFQPDQIHPTPAAQPLILKHVLPAIEKLL